MTTNGATTMRTTHIIGITLLCGVLGAIGCTPLQPGGDHPATTNQPAAGTCGAVGQQCCANSTCNNGATCANGTCAAVTTIPTPTPAPVACGGASQPCCNGTACAAGNTCVNSVCTAQSNATCGGFGQVCCAGNVCPNGVGLACGSNGLCAAANSLPTPMPNLPMTPGITPCLTTSRQLGTVNNGTCVPIPIMTAPNPNGPRIVSAFNVARFTDERNPSAFCAGLTHDARAILNETGPQCLRINDGSVMCSTDGNGREVYWARDAAQQIEADNACEGATAERPRVYVAFRPTFLRRAMNGRVNVRDIACEIERALGVPSDVAFNLAQALHTRPYQLDTQPSGEVPGLMTPPGTI